MFSNNLRWILSASVMLTVIYLMGESQVQGMPNGAPKVACATMTPTANHIDKTINGEQDLKTSPYDITPEKKKMSSSESLNVKLAVKSSKSDSDLAFKGFMMMAFDSANDTAAIGTWTIDSAFGKTMDCSFGSKVAVTHKDSSNKTSVSATWTPPTGYTGTVFMRTSFVQKLVIFWVRQNSDAVVVA